MGGATSTIAPGQSGLARSITPSVAMERIFLDAEVEQVRHYLDVLKYNIETEDEVRQEAISSTLTFDATHLDTRFHASHHGGTTGVLHMYVESNINTFHNFTMSEEENGLVFRRQFLQG